MVPSLLFSWVLPSRQSSGLQGASPLRGLPGSRDECSLSLPVCYRYLCLLCSSASGPCSVRGPRNRVCFLSYSLPLKGGQRGGFFRSILVSFAVVGVRTAPGQAVGKACAVWWLALNKQESCFPRLYKQAKCKREQHVGQVSLQLPSMGPLAPSHEIAASSNCKSRGAGQRVPLALTGWPRARLQEDFHWPPRRH